MFGRRARIAALLLGLLATAAAAPGAAPGLPGASDETRAAATALVVTNHLGAAIAGTVPALRDSLVSQLVVTTHKPRETVVAIVDDILMPAMKAHVDELTEAVIEIYAANYTIDDLHALNAFYATAVGQKSVRLIPLIAQQSNAAAQAWAQRVVPEAIRAHAQELRDRGLSL